MEATQDTHTHTHERTRRPEVTVNLSSAFSHPGLSLLQDPPGVEAACKRPGTKSSERSIFGQGWTCVLFFLHVFLLGFVVQETPCEHGENMQTIWNNVWNCGPPIQPRFA